MAKRIEARHVDNIQIVGDMDIVRDKPTVDFDDVRNTVTWFGGDVETRQAGMNQVGALLNRHSLGIGSNGVTALSFTRQSPPPRSTP